MTDYETGNFPDATREAWLELVEETLAGKPFSTLTTTTLDGIEIQPLYDGDGAGEAELTGVGGLAEEDLDGRLDGGSEGQHSAWEVLAFCDLGDGGDNDERGLAQTDAVLRAEMEGGADGVVLRLDGPVNTDDLRFLLSAMVQASQENSEDQANDAAGKEVNPAQTTSQESQIRLAFEAGPWWQSAAFSLAQLAEAGGGDLLAGLGLENSGEASGSNSKGSERASAADSAAAGSAAKSVDLQISLRADPIAALARHGTMGKGNLADLVVKKPAALSHVRTVGVDASVFSDAGASEAQEIACSLAAGVWHLREFAEAGINIDAACAEMEFTYAATADQFATVAKLRAAKQCWHRIAEASGASPAARRQRQHAVTSRSMLTRHDPMVNVLRSTVAAFAAGVAGVDSQCVLPYDIAIGAPSDDSRRLARNISHILIQESNIGHVADPARGSAYVAELTRSIAEKAWELFQQIEAKGGTDGGDKEKNGAGGGEGESGTAEGGIVAALKDGTIGRWLEDSWQKRTERIVRRKDPICGVSEFPVLGETRPGKAAWTQDDPESSMQAVDDGNNLANGQSEVSPDSTANEDIGGSFKPLPIRRFAEPFERLRDAVDEAVSDGSVAGRPVVFLAALESLAVATPRVAFSENLLAAAGIKSEIGAGGADEIAKVFSESEASIAVLCSTDKIYAEQVPVTAAALREAGCEWIYLAGRPKGDLAALVEATGIDGTIYAGCDAVALLEEMLERLGIEIEASESGRETNPSEKLSEIQSRDETGHKDSSESRSASENQGVVAK